MKPSEHDNDDMQAVRILDRYLHPSLSESPELLLKARILIATLLTGGLILIIAALILVVPDIPAVNRLLGYSIITSELIIIALCLATLKHQGNYRLSSHIFLGVITTGILLTPMVTGGPLHSPITQLLILPPLLGYFLLGLDWGIRYTIVTIAVTALMTLLSLAGVEFQQTLKPDMMAETRLLVFGIGFSITGTLAFFYEKISRRLRNERDRERRTFARLAQTDSLTGLANRRNFDLHAQDRLRTSAQQARPQPFTLCYIDLDGFKAINDGYGHDVGDEVLQIVAKRLQTTLRGMDFICRQGGDEFILFLEELGDRDEISQLAQRLLIRINEPMNTSRGPLRVGSSLGFACYPAHGSDLEDLRVAADAAMYLAKRSGGGWRLA